MIGTEKAALQNHVQATSQENSLASGQISNKKNSGDVMSATF